MYDGRWEWVDPLNLTGGIKVFPNAVRPGRPDGSSYFGKTEEEGGGI